MAKHKKSRYKDYWSYGEAHFKHDSNGGLIEPVLANPDILTEEDGKLWNERSEDEIASGYQRHVFLTGLFQSLSPKEKEVFKLLSTGMTQERMAHILRVSRERIKNIVKIIQDKGEKHRTKKPYLGDIVKGY